MMSMLLLNMQSSMQMMPFIQMRQQQQQKQNHMFQNYLSQMQALNSLLHTMSYGTPLSELNKMHYEVRDKYDGYNQQVHNPLIPFCFLDAKSVSWHFKASKRIEAER